MTNSTAAIDFQFRRRNRRTRWLATLFEGFAAATFIRLLVGDNSAAGIAFGIVALISFLLWPMTIRGSEFSFGRLTIFGILVVLLGAYFWLLFVELSMPSHLPNVSHVEYLWSRYSQPGHLLSLLTQTLQGTTIG